MEKISAIRGFVAILIAFLWLLPAVGEAVTKKRTCGPQPGQTLQHFIDDELQPGDTLLVNGTCNENVVIRANSITIDGQGAATIDGSGDPTKAAVQIFGRGVTVKGFTIIGGRHGVHVFRGGTASVDGNLIQGAAVHGVLVSNGSVAQIVNNTVQGNQNGVVVTESASADIGFRGDFTQAPEGNLIQKNSSIGVIVNDSSNGEIQGNTISGNGNAGIFVGGSSQARIGFRAATPGSFSAPNAIEKNGNDGIRVEQSSGARITANLITGNTGSGVRVDRVAHANISDNDIDGNTDDGITVSRNSGVNLGRDTGVNPDDLPNRTTVNNGTPGLPGPPVVSPTGFGIRCFLNSYADGRLGSLNGHAGAKSFSSAAPGANSGGCHDSLNP